MSISKLDDLEPNDPLITTIRELNREIAAAMRAVRRKHPGKSAEWYAGYRAHVMGFRPGEGADYYCGSMRYGYAQAMKDAAEASPQGEGK